MEVPPGTLGLCVMPSDPTSGARCAAEYANFLTIFSSHLKAHGLRLATFEPNGFIEGPWKVLRMMDFFKLKMMNLY